MDEKELFLRFWTHESETTRRVFSRIPEGATYKPDPKSRTAQEIAWQMVEEERAIVEALETGTMSWSPAPMPASMREVERIHAEQSLALIARWKALPQERWGGTLQMWGHPRAAAPMAWSFLFDLVHHRGQISTYLRPMGAKVPQIYGPSGDEP